MILGLLGATGRTGRLVLDLALKAGHTVRALVRRPGSLAVTHPGLAIVEGDARDADAVRRLAEGCDAVISTVGPTKAGFDICSVSTAHLLAGGVKRIVVVSGAGVNVPGDAKGRMGRFISWMVRTVTPTIYEDKVKQQALLAASDVEWVLVRPPRLHDGAGTGSPRATLDDVASSSLSRHDLAAFCLSEAVSPKFARRAPFLST